MDGEFLLESQKESIEILEDLLEKAKKGEVVEIIAWATRPDGCYITHASKHDNKFAMAGAMLSATIEQLGFARLPLSEWEQKQVEGDHTSE